MKNESLIGFGMQLLLSKVDDDDDDGCIWVAKIVKDDKKTFCIVIDATHMLVLQSSNEFEDIYFWVS